MSRSKLPASPAMRRASSPRPSGTSSPAPPRDRGSSPLPALLAAALIAAAAAWAYGNSLDGVFVLDDVPGVVQNASIRAPAGARWLSPPPGSTPSGRPLLNISLALNYAAGGLAVRGYHAVNVALHALAAIALFGVLRRTLQSERLRARFGADAGPLAFGIAALWAVHPLTTGAVTYIVQRGEILMALCLVLTLYCASRGWQWLAVAACALGMASKETMAAAPLLVVLWDYLFLPGGARRRGFYAALAATWIVLVLPMFAETQGRTIVWRLLGLTPKTAGDTWTAWSYLWTQAGVIVHYLSLAVKPWPLAFDYYGWPPAVSPLDVLPQLALVSSALAVTVWGLLRRAPAAFAGAVFFLSLAPTSSVVPIPTEIAAEHRMYLPLAAVLTLLVVSVFLLARRARAAFAIVVLVTIAGCAQLTRSRNLDYRSAEVLWGDTVAQRPSNARARINYGIELMKGYRQEHADHENRAAMPLEMVPETAAQVHLQLGSALAAQGRLDEGIASIRRALEIDDDILEADAILGEAYFDKGDHRSSLRHFLRAHARQPAVPFIPRRAAWLLATSTDPSVRDPAKAIELGERAVALGGGTDMVAFETVAAAYAAAGRPADAITAVDRAIALARASGDASSLATYQQHRAYYGSMIR